MRGQEGSEKRNGNVMDKRTHTGKLMVHLHSASIGAPVARESSLCGKIFTGLHVCVYVCAGVIGTPGVEYSFSGCVRSTSKVSVTIYAYLCG